MKICPNCKNCLMDTETKCDKCGFALSENASVAPMIGSKTEGWMYVIAFLIPFAGIILGCVQVAKNDNKGARGLFVVSLISILVRILIIVATVFLFSYSQHDIIR